MSEKCPICGRGIGVYQDYVGGTSFFRCDICGHTGCDFEDMTVFDRITESPETLAEKLVFWMSWHKADGAVEWYAVSTVAEGKWSTKEEAIAATVAKLKEVVECPQHCFEGAKANAYLIAAAPEMYRNNEQTLTELEQMIPAMLAVCADCNHRKCKVCQFAKVLKTASEMEMRIEQVQKKARGEK